MLPVSKGEMIMMRTKNEKNRYPSEITVHSKEELKSAYRKLLQLLSDDELLVINVKEKDDGAEETDKRTDEEG